MTTTTIVEIGNAQGQYFTQWRFDLLLELLEMIKTGPIPGTSEAIKIENPKIWYDATEDFHNLSFSARNHFVEVRLYKVFASKIDGVDKCFGSRSIWNYSNFIRKELGIQPKGIKNE